jgi:hypothetical protein
VLVDGVPVGVSVPAGSATGCRSRGRLESTWSRSGATLGVVDEGGAGGLVGERWAGWARGGRRGGNTNCTRHPGLAEPVAGWGGEVATRHRPVGRVLVDQVGAGSI